MQKKYNPVAKITVIGVGGGGNNSIKTMIESKNLEGVNFLVANTDKQVLDNFDQNLVIHLGSENRESGNWGLGAGADPKVGEEAALTSEKTIKDRLEDSKIVIITAGMGGGTGTGAAPVVAKIAKSINALTIAIVTLPFSYEGTSRSKQAKIGLEKLTKEVDLVVIISNSKLKDIYGSLPIKDSFKYADQILKQAVRTITDIMSTSSLINLDYADMKKVIANKGNGVIGIGSASGQNRARQAAINSVSSAILEYSVIGATSAIINVSMDTSKGSLDEAEEISQTIKEIVSGSADNSETEMDIIYGVTDDKNLGDEIYVSVIITGLKGEANKQIDSETLKQEVEQQLQKSKNEKLRVLKTQEMTLENSLNLTKSEREELEMLRLKAQQQKSFISPQEPEPINFPHEINAKHKKYCSFWCKLRNLFKK